MRQYARTLGMVLVVFGGAGVLGVLHRAFVMNPNAMDVAFVLERSAGFVAMFGFGIYFMFFVKVLPPKQ
jgi:hypothetical protein